VANDIDQKRLIELDEEATLRTTRYFGHAFPADNWHLLYISTVALMVILSVFATVVGAGDAEIAVLIFGAAFAAVWFLYRRNAQSRWSHHRTAIFEGLVEAEKHDIARRNRLRQKLQPDAE
jgi:4-hydroxybenzoate polyprenyltransferase